MRFHLLLSILICASAPTYSQSSDFIVLKKNGKTRHSWYAGTQIEFVTTEGAYRNAFINAVKNDTLYLQEFLVRRIPTTLGTYILDTAGSFHYAYHYRQIRQFGQKDQRNFNWRGSGSSLMGGAALLILGSGIVYVADRDKFSPALLGGAVALGGLGYLMNRAGSKGITVGKKGYTIEYMDMTP